MRLWRGKERKAEKGMDRQDSRGFSSPTQGDISNTGLPSFPRVSSRFSYVGCKNSEFSRATEKAQENPRETHCYTEYLCLSKCRH